MFSYHWQATEQILMLCLGGIRLTRDSWVSVMYAET